MEEKQKPRQRGMWVAVALALLVMYPLSSGPYYALDFGGYVPERSSSWVYYPVEAPMYKNDNYTTYYNAYRTWWVSLADKFLY